MSLDTGKQSILGPVGRRKRTQALRIQQGTRKKPLHPVQVLELAYGLAEDGNL